MDERSTPEPITSRASYYIEPVDETALADELPADVVVVVVALTVVAIPIVVDVPAVVVVAVDLTFEPVEAKTESCGFFDVGDLPR